MRAASRPQPMRPGRRRRAGAALRRRHHRCRLGRPRPRRSARTLRRPRCPARPCRVRSAADRHRRGSARASQVRWSPAPARAATTLHRCPPRTARLRQRGPARARPPNLRSRARGNLEARGARQPRARRRRTGTRARRSPGNRYTGRPARCPAPGSQGLIPSTISTTTVGSTKRLCTRDRIAPALAAARTRTSETRSGGGTAASSRKMRPPPRTSQPISASAQCSGPAGSRQTELRPNEGCAP